MARNAVVDKGIEDWFEERKELLKEKYSEVFQVGAHELLDERASDDEITHFCRDNDCDLYTPDMKIHERDSSRRRSRRLRSQITSGGRRSIFC